MRHFAVSALALVAGLALPAATAVNGQQAVFRAGTQIVPVITTVIDSNGRLVPGLEQDQFTILDNGKPVDIVSFENDVQPFTAVVMMDYSASMTANLDLLQAAAEQ